MLGEESADTVRIGLLSLHFKYLQAITVGECHNYERVPFSLEVSIALLELFWHLDLILLCLSKALLD